MDKKVIDSFYGEYRFLSNFYEATVFYEDIEYPTSEHCFQAAKIHYPSCQATFDARIDVIMLETPGQAKRWGKKVPLRPDWQEVKYSIMYDIVLAKFRQHPSLAKKLIETGDAELIEGNTWGDKIWGVCDGVGTNWLGKILMEVRGKLK